MGRSGRFQAGSRRYKAAPEPRRVPNSPCREQSCLIGRLPKPAPISGFVTGIRRPGSDFRGLKSHSRVSIMVKLLLVGAGSFRKQCHKLILASPSPNRLSQNRFRVKLLQLTDSSEVSEGHLQPFRLLLRARHSGRNFDR